MAFWAETKRELAERIGIPGKQPAILTDNKLRWWFDDKHDGSLLTIDENGRVSIGWGGWSELFEHTHFNGAKEIYAYLEHVGSADAETFHKEMYKWISTINNKYPLKRG